LIRKIFKTGASIENFAQKDHKFFPPTFERTIRNKGTFVGEFTKSVPNFSWREENGFVINRVRVLYKGVLNYFVYPSSTGQRRKLFFHT